MAQPAKEQSGPTLVTRNNAYLHGEDHPFDEHTEPQLAAPQTTGTV